MSVKTVAELKSRFETGDTPTGQDFIDFLDSFLHGQFGNFPNPLPAVSGKNLTEIGDALPAVLPARDGSLLTNINPKEYNVPGSMPVPSYATANTFVLSGDFTVSATDVNNRIFLIGRRLRIKIADAYTYTEAQNAVFAAGTTTVTALDAMPGSPIQEVAVGVITPFALGGAVGPGTIGIADLANRIAFTAVVFTGFFVAADLPAGWVIMNDGTIGNAASGATTRANADTAALFTRLWTNISNTWAPVSSGRGASAAADFAANKTLTLPRALGRALAGSGAGSGLTARALGEFLGEETHLLTSGESGLREHQHIMWRYGASIGGGSVEVLVPSGTDTLTGGVYGGGLGALSAHNNMSPETFMNFAIKL